MFMKKKKTGVSAYLRIHSNFLSVSLFRLSQCKLFNQYDDARTTCVRANKYVYTRTLLLHIQINI